MVHPSETGIRPPFHNQASLALEQKRSSLLEEGSSQQIRGLRTSESTTPSPSLIHRDDRDRVSLVLLYVLGQASSFGTQGVHALNPKVSRPRDSRRTISFGDPLQPSCRIRTTSREIGSLSPMSSSRLRRSGLARRGADPHLPISRIAQESWSRSIDLCPETGFGFHPV